MSLALWGAVLGGLTATAALTSLHRAMTVRRPRLEVRVLPYVRDLSAVGGDPQRTTSRHPSVFTAVFGPALQGMARTSTECWEARRRCAAAWSGPALR